MNAKNKDDKAIEIVRYPVEDLKNSKKFKAFSDVLDVVLDKSKEYTVEEVESAIEAFLATPEKGVN